MKTLFWLAVFTVSRVFAVTCPAAGIVLPGHGVVGDGVTDDTAAIQAVVNANPATWIEFTGTHTYLVGTGGTFVTLPDHSYICVDAGATLRVASGVYLAAPTHPIIFGNSNWAAGTNTDIQIIGAGTLDGNLGGQSLPCCTVPNGTIHLANTNRSVVNGLTMKDPIVFAVYCYDGCNYNQFANLNNTQSAPRLGNDSVHLSGAATYDVIYNITGRTGDDVVCLCANEASGGDETNIFVKKLNVTGDWSAVRFRVDTETINNVLVENVAGSYANGYPIFMSTPAGGCANTGVMNNIQVDTVSATGNGGNFLAFFGSHSTLKYSNVAGGSTGITTLCGSSNSATSVPGPPTLLPGFDFATVLGTSTVRGQSKLHGQAVQR